jgi:Tetracyclin repressor-like, C-terminal domain
MFGGAIASLHDYPELGAASQATYELLVATVRGGIDSGALRGTDPEGVALACWALVHGLSQLIAGGQLHSQPQSEPPRALALSATQLLLQGIGAHAKTDSNQAPLKTKRKAPSRT